MKKNSIFLTILLFCATSIFAQKISFQAVVRNNANELVPNTTLTVAVSVLDASNNVQYSENHTGVQTNQNGLLSLMVGDGTPTSATTMADVVWSGASIRTVITLPGGATITNTTPINAVPYALSAGNVDPAVVADAIADYIAHHSIGGEDNVQADWDETDPTSDAYVQHKPTDVSAFNNDANYVTTTQLNAANYITAADVPAQVNADWNATSGAAQIMNKPTIPTVPANVSEFNNDANYVTTTQLNAANYITAADIPAQVNADWNATSGAAQILNKPALFDGDYNSLSNKPTIPTVPANVSEFNNDAQYVNNSTCDTIDFCSLVTKMAEMQSHIEQQNLFIDSLKNLNKDGSPCLGTPVVYDFDGNIYNTVKIGNQCWMRENLRTTHYADGQSIFYTDQHTSPTVSFPIRRCPNDDSTLVPSLGYVYNFDAVLYRVESGIPYYNNQAHTASAYPGICPVGWHVPSYAEWMQLRNYLGSQSQYVCGNDSLNIAKSLASTTGWKVDTLQCSPGNNPSSNNATGFGAQPLEYSSGESRAYFRTQDRRVVFIASNRKDLWRHLDDTRVTGYSVRCLRD